MAPVALMDVESVIAAGERLDSSDGARALALARPVTRSEREAHKLLDEAEGTPRRPPARLRVRGTVERLDAALLARGQLTAQRSLHC